MQDMRPTGLNQFGYMKSRWLLTVLTLHRIPHSSGAAQITSKPIYLHDQLHRQLTAVLLTAVLLTAFCAASHALFERLGGLQAFSNLSLQD